jgi:hypothetical protein
VPDRPHGDPGVRRELADRQHVEGSFRQLEDRGGTTIAAVPSPKVDRHR